MGTSTRRGLPAALESIVRTEQVLSISCGAPVPDAKENMLLAYTADGERL